MELELPPKPDQRTGEPFPPSAPRYVGSTKPPTREFGPLKKPEPPQGAGPILAWWTDTLWSRLQRFAWALAIVAVLPIVVAILSGEPPFFLYPAWQMWIILVPIGYMMGQPRTVETQAAGADWFQWSFKKRWYHKTEPKAVLYFYELVEVTLESHGVLFFLTLSDKYGTTCSRPRLDLQNDRRIWDLLYNGILHSVANGCKINHAVIDYLQLFDTPAMRLRAARFLEEGDPGTA